MSTIYAYDSAGFLGSLSHGRPGDLDSINASTYTRDAKGRVTEIDTIADGLIAYTYDAADQLRSESRDGVLIESYDWDLAGNRLRPGTVVGAGNRLQSDGEFDYSYDAEGRRESRTNIVSNETTRYEYDAAGRLVSASEYANPSSTQSLRTSTTIFDAVGRRLSEQSETFDGSGNLLSSDLNRFDYEGWNTTSLRDVNGDLKNSFVHGPGVDKVLADLKHDALGTGVDSVVHALGDHQGTVRDFAVVDSAIDQIASVGHRDYDAFGGLRSSTYELTSASTDVADAASIAQQHLFGYTGREHTAQEDRYDYRMRSYDAASTRFLQTDPLGLRAGDTNLYRYVGNNAVGYIDPLGLGVHPPAGPYEGSVPNETRHAPGTPECACSCSCVSGQLDALNNSSQAAPIEPEVSAKQEPNLPGTKLPSGSDSKSPVPVLSNTPNTNQYVGSNPVNSMDPSGQMAVSKDPIGFAAGDANLYRYVGNQPTTKTDPSGLVEEDPPREQGHRSGNNPEKHSAAQRARRLQQQNAVRRAAQEARNDVVNDAFKHIDNAIADLEVCRKTEERKMLRGGAGVSDYRRKFNELTESIERLKEIEVTVEDGQIVDVKHIDELPDSALKSLTKKGRWIIRGGSKVFIPLTALTIASSASRGYAGDGFRSEGGAVGAFVEIGRDACEVETINGGVRGWAEWMGDIIGLNRSSAGGHNRRILDAAQPGGGIHAVPKRAN